ncbi:hypothetical protein FNF27_01859 [Cafeteria roenbergensis]|uniref:Uncharacterized protein n=1 Tax=Cafeteria roenbergensis TaxID=33653 RepID=A0A5A8CZE6_CAFRO|nr:hypothetical protein FNF29_00513 [Cafeteria roenbergensis]KAA0169000.1 hypothetical protein FNF31_00161 [Cafeteria roenbergensis]KAA0176578.1 hypothetical protein FNF27_01859 [Cafeteria roenbergensis]|eukprot:KAA0157161.1 hypothetical protein FNF29_00513 [Cafeteria roenbergensis]
MAGSLARAEAVAQADAPEKSTKPRFDANSIPGGHLPPLEPTKAEIYNVVFEYGVLIGNFLMIAFIATWYMKKVAWTKDPEDLSRSTRPLVTRASSDPAFDPILPGTGERG